MFEDPRIIAALISSFVSILIASVSGFYIVAKSRNAARTVMRSVIAEAHAKRFSEEAIRYRREYDRYLEVKRKIDEENEIAGTQADGTILAQHILDFFGTSKEFYWDNQSVLQSGKLDEKFMLVQDLIDSGALNDHQSTQRRENIETALKTSISIFEELRARAVGAGSPP